MITFPCDKCEKLLETDDSAAGTRSSARTGGDINIVPTRGREPSARPAMARPAAQAHDRAAAMGLPSEAGPRRSP